MAFLTNPYVVAKEKLLLYPFTRKFFMKKLRKLLIMPIIVFCSVVFVACGYVDNLSSRENNGTPAPTITNTPEPPAEPSLKWPGNCDCRYTWGVHEECYYEAVVSADENGSVVVHENVDWHMEGRRNAPYFCEDNWNASVRDKVSPNLGIFFEAAPNNGYYFEKWLLLDKHGVEINISHRVYSGEYNQRLWNFISKQTTDYYAHWYNVYEIKAVFTNDETKLVDTVQPPITVYKTGNANITIHEYAPQKVEGTVLMARAIADKNTVITRRSTLVGFNQLNYFPHPYVPSIGYHNYDAITQTTWEIWVDIDLTNVFGQAERMLFEIAEIEIETIDTDAIIGEWTSIAYTLCGMQETVHYTFFANNTVKVSCGGVSYVVRYSINGNRISFIKANLWVNSANNIYICQTVGGVFGVLEINDNTFTITTGSTQFVFTRY